VCVFLVLGPTGEFDTFAATAGQAAIASGVVAAEKANNGRSVVIGLAGCRSETAEGRHRWWRVGRRR